MAITSPTKSRVHPNSKITLDRIQAIAEGVRRGMYPHRAASLAGVSDQSCYRWLEQGRAEQAQGMGPGESLFVAFVEAIKASEAEFIAECLEVIRAAGKMPQHWTSAMTHLERRFPDEYGQKGRVTIENPALESFSRAILAALEKPSEWTMGPAKPPMLPAPQARESGHTGNS